MLLVFLIDELKITTTEEIESTYNPEEEGNDIVTRSEFINRMESFMFILTIWIENE